MGPLPRCLSKIVLLFADRPALPCLGLTLLALPRIDSHFLGMNRRRGDAEIRGGYQSREYWRTAIFASSGLRASASPVRCQARACFALLRMEQEARRRGDQRRMPEQGSGQLDRRGQASMVRKQLVQFTLR